MKITQRDGDVGSVYGARIRGIPSPEHFILASDLGQYLNPIPTDGLKAFVLSLRRGGFSEREIKLMCRDTPAQLLGLSDSPQRHK